MTASARPLRLLLCALVGAIVSMVFASSALAGSYTVYACPGGNQAPNGSQAFAYGVNGSGFTAANNCANGSPTYRDGLNASNRADTVGAYASAGFAFTAPSGTTITTVDHQDARYSDQPGWLYGWWKGDGSGALTPLYHNYPTKDAYAGCGGGPGCPPSPEVNNWAYGTQTDTVNAPVAWFGIICASSQCHGSSKISGPNAPGVVFASRSIAVHVNDPVAPSIAAGGQLMDGTWQHGTRSFGILAGDSTGVHQIAAAIPDNSTYFQQDYACDYYKAAPCSNQGAVWNVDTTKLGDGAHQIQFATYDAANNAGSNAAVFKVDNHPPNKPVLTVAGGESWRASNSFNVSWTISPQGNGSPVDATLLCLSDKAGNMVKHPDGTPWCYGASGSTNSMTVTVPGPGEYHLGASEHDAAGYGQGSNLPFLRFDPTVPGAAQHGHLNGWISASEAAANPDQVTLPSTSAVGPSGISGYSVTTDGSDPDNTVDIPAGVGPSYTASYPLTSLPDGVTTIKARAISGASVASSDVKATTVQIDRQAPSAAASGSPDPGVWQTSPVTLSLTGADQPNLSGMGPTSTISDPSQDGHMTYRLDGGAPQVVRGPSASVPVSSDGRHTLTYSATDVAGNTSGERSVAFKIDRTPPETLGFAAQDPNDPRQITAIAADSMSGVASGVIQMRPAGGAWKSLPTTLSGDRLLARVDDTNMAPGNYQFQVSATDVAGNTATTDRFLTGDRAGQPFTISGSLRQLTKVALSMNKPRAGLTRVCKRVRATKRVALRSHGHVVRRHGKVVYHTVYLSHRVALRSHGHVVRRHGKVVYHTVYTYRQHCQNVKTAPKLTNIKRVCKHVKVLYRHHRVTRLRCHTIKVPGPSATPRPVYVPFGSRKGIYGTLTTIDGKPITGAAVNVTQTLDMPGASASSVGRVVTDRYGNFVYSAPAGASRSIGFEFDGTNVLRPTSGAQGFRVKGALTFRPTKRSLRNHQTLRITGRLKGRPFPAAGQLVILQAQVPHRGWVTFETVRTSAAGFYKGRYRFSSTHHTTVYSMRAMIRPEPSYPYELGISPVAKVRVRP